MPATPSCSALGAPIIVRPNGYAASEGGSVRGSPCDAPARLRLTSLRPSSCGCCAGNRGPGAMRGVPQSGLWSEEELASSGTGSERSQGRERSGCGSPPRARVLPPEAALRSYGGCRREL